MSEKKRIVLFEANTNYNGVPLALLAITSMLDSTRYDIRIFTHRTCKDYREKILAACDGALCFGVSCVTGIPIKAALDMSRKVKARYPELPIIWGGWQCITLPDVTLNNPAVDYVCTGQGERAFAEFVESLADNSCRIVPGINSKQNGVIVRGPERPLEDINNFPDCKIDLIEWEKYYEASSYGDRTLRLVSSVGCPYRCTFCCEENHCGRRWYALPAERMIAFIKRLRARVDFNGLFYTDNNWFTNEKRVSDFCRLMLENNLNIPLGGLSGRSNELTKYKPETWELLKRAGVKTIFIGAESADEETLQFIKKDITVRQTLDLCKLCHRYKIRATLSFVMGFPLPAYFSRETNAVFLEEFNALWAFYKNIHDNISKTCFQFYISFYLPFPGSPLFALAVQKGFKPPVTLEEWGRYEMAHVHTPWLVLNNVNDRRIRMFKYIIRLLGQDYQAYIKMLPVIVRFPGVLLVCIAQGIARWRMRYDFFKWPLDQFIFQSAERLFRSLNHLAGWLNIGDYEIDSAVSESGTAMTKETEMFLKR